MPRTQLQPLVPQIRWPGRPPILFSPLPDESVEENVSSGSQHPYLGRALEDANTIASE